MFTINCGRFLASFGVLCCALTSCDTITEISPKETETAQTHVLYTIPEGAHYCDKNTYKEVRTNYIKFEVIFDSSAVYTTALAGNQGDINKLFGLSDCNSSHHTNSARFGWRWYKNQLELLAYTYLNKKWEYRLLGAVPIGKAVACEIKAEGQQYTFSMDGKTVSMPRACDGDMVGYQLYPYFGGDETAPHAITIKIKEQQ
ncbi:hypothetical protein [Pontibacter akesuensis]|uniref:Uncharacterized protein n=1 Tax=Pontibacter akesuensis TaxID=388950 RepID=A0A1I7G686_9BACT|nr:hypothetical protein [Pontibacter akesuensis]GHA58572.1 hypothetical protein GCM10007389_08120 [Pontibacter akesuensis]SFU43949.1 hypothetical protein SAMN04487941_0752 [Pontibacter akesuensis]